MQLGSAGEIGAVPSTGTGKRVEVGRVLRAAGGQPATLREVGIERAALPTLARLAAQQWTAGFNPRPVGETELRSLYEAAW